VRRATEELKVARDYEQVRRILVAAFGTNDFDGFDLHVKLVRDEYVPFEAREPFHKELSFHWTKAGGPKSFDGLAVWTLALDLLSSTNQRWGSLSMHRLYSQRDLQLDVNLLTSSFPRALADALDRTLGHGVQVIPLPEQDAGLLAAQAG